MVVPSDALLNAGTIDSAPWRLAVLTSAPDRRVTAAIATVADAAAQHGFELVATFVAQGADLAAAPELSSITRIRSIPMLTLDPRIHRTSGPSWRQRYERIVIDTLTPFRPEIVLLLGYGLIAGPTLLAAWPMVNVHPAVPGGRVGTERALIDELIATGAPTTGVMSHLVTEDLDAGPVIASVEIAIPPPERTWPRRNPRRVIAELHGQVLEPLLVETLQRLADELGSRPRVSA